MNPIRLAVVGAGHLGRIHARLSSSLDNVQLVGVVDPQVSARRQVATETGTHAFSHHGELLGHIDAAVVATPTCYHYQTVLDLLQHDVHILVEKPIAASTEQADELIRCARERHLILQVGHVERFNPAFQLAAPLLAGPKYIETVRASGYTFRSTDVGVVLDLMIHDVDLVLSLVDSPLKQVQALGISVLGGHEDMAQARLQFENGCVANLSASRTSFQPLRKMQVFCEQAYAAIDFAERSVQMVRPAEQLRKRELNLSRLSRADKEDFRNDLFHRWLSVEQPSVPEGNALLEELRDFTRSIRTNQPPRVDGRQGGAALEVAQQVLTQIRDHRWDGTASGRVGPLAAPAPAIVHTPQWQHQSEPLPSHLRKAG